MSDRLMRSMARTLGAFLPRLVPYVVAALVIVILLHIPAGLQTADGRTGYSGSKFKSAVTSYLANLTRGELGTLKALGPPGYREDQPVARVVRDQAPRSLGLMGLALGISLVLGTALGAAASHFGRARLRPAALTGNLLLLSCPDILLAVILRKGVILGMQWYGMRLLDPSSTLTGVGPADFVAPALALAAIPTAVVARVLAVALDDVHAQLYIRTAISKGLGPWQVLWDHALKNAWVRVTDAGPILAGSLATGVMVVEHVFYFPGIGRTLAMILERGGQPGPSATFTLVLLAGTMMIDILLGAIRMRLDPRFGHAATGSGPARERFSPRRLTELRHLPGRLVEGLQIWLADVPHNLVSTAWRLRPLRMMREAVTNPPLLIGLLGVTTLVVLALFGGQLADLRTGQTIPKYLIVAERVIFPPYPPGVPGFPWGSDAYGRDLLSRILVGARYTLFFTLAVTPVRFLAAVPWGLMAGFRGGGSTKSLSLIFSAIPVILIPASLLPLMGLMGGGELSRSSFWLITLILALDGIPKVAENIRKQVQATLVQPFIEGAVAAGAESGRILRKHVLPHLVPQLWVTAATDMAWTLLTLAQLGVFSIFVGGAARVATYGEMDSRTFVPRIADWSSMLAKPYEVLYRAPWALWIPALGFLFAIASFNLAAEGLRKYVQRQVSGPPLPETSPQGWLKGAPGRRLALEWATAASLAAALLLSGAVYGMGNPTTRALATGSVLDRSRHDLQVRLDTLYGTGYDEERRTALDRLPEVLTTYLGEVFKEKRSAIDIQQDSRGRLNLFEVGRLRLVQYQVPSDLRRPGEPLSHLLIQDLSAAGRVSDVAAWVKPTYLGLTADGLLVFTGVIPGSDTWGISIWRQHQGNWLAAPDAVAALHRQIPPDLKAEPFTGASRSEVELRAAGSVARVSADGIVEVCPPNRSLCTTIPVRP